MRLTLRNQISAVILGISAIDAAGFFLVPRPAIVCEIVAATAVLGLLLSYRIASPARSPAAPMGPAASAEAQKLALLNETMASVRHDINNPLMIISGNAQILEMMMTDSPEDQKERVRSILHETERIGQVMRRLRDLKQVAKTEGTEPA